MNKKTTVVLILALCALPAAAQVNWNSDPMTAARPALAQAAPVAAPQGKPVAAPSAAIEGVADGGPVLVASKDPDVRNVHLKRLLHDADHGFPRLVAQGQACSHGEEPGEEGEIECSSFQFEFPDVSILGRVASSNGRAVAHINGSEDVIPDAYELQWDAAGGKLAVRLAPASQAYKGSIEQGGKLVDVCLTLAPQIVDQYAGDYDMSQGVYIYRSAHMREGAQSCGTSWEINGDFVRSCSGLFLYGLKDGYAQEPAGIYGNVFDVTQIDRLYNPETGELAQKPVGHYVLSRVTSCQ